MTGARRHHHRRRRGHHDNNRLGNHNNNHKTKQLLPPVDEADDATTTTSSSTTAAATAAAASLYPPQWHLSSSSPSPMKRHEQQQEKPLPPPPLLSCQEPPQPPHHYDVCIVGAGPAGLACLSAIREPFSLDSLSESQVTRAVRSFRSGHRPRSVCVIDPADHWLAVWQHQFATLGIDHLRSPALAHVHAYDQNALFSYAMAHGRAEHELYESGCFELKHILPLGQAQIGLWQLPSTALFTDFCYDTVQRLPHDYLRGTVTDVYKNKNDDNNEYGPFQVIVDQQQYDPTATPPSTSSSSSLSSLSTQHRCITADAVILAMGVAGAPSTIPRALHTCPPHRLVQWHQLDQLPTTITTTVTTTRSSSSSSNSSSTDHHPTTPMSPSPKPLTATPRQYLVVGGGLTAAQVALKLGTDDPTCQVVLCSRRPLMERHFDIPVAWFDRRTATKCLYDFYHGPVTDRLAMLRATKDGGSIPPIYMHQLRRRMQQQQLQCLIGEPVYLEEEAQNDDTASMTTKSTFRIKLNEAGGADTTKESSSTMQSTEPIYKFDAVIVACGTRPNCLSNPLLRKIYHHWPDIDICDGYPAVSQDLQWTDKLFVIGSLGALHTGPDGANLMGIRRAALTIAQSLHCRGWLRETTLTNPFAGLFADDDSSSGSELVADNDDEGDEIVGDAVSTSGSSDNADL